MRAFTEGATHDSRSMKSGVRSHGKSEFVSDVLAIECLHFVHRKSAMNSVETSIELGRPR